MEDFDLKQYTLQNEVHFGAFQTITQLVHG